MVSRDRCKETFQGDRCCKARSHEGPHESNNVVWIDPGMAEGYAMQKHPRLCHRKRSLNRQVKAIVLHGVAPELRPQAIKILKFFEENVRA